ncbi:MAG: GIY-YIG nuclease family protein [Pseudomonadota bacterium]
MQVGTSDAAALPIETGAYLLLIDLDRSVELPPRFRDQRLPEGHYVYAGSAYGPGGIRARCRRHLGRPSKRRWHIDWLTSAATSVRAIPFPGGSECALIDVLSKRPEVDYPIRGFGSTDCGRCQAHLVRIAAHADGKEVDVVSQLGQPVR